MFGGAADDRTAYFNLRSGGVVAVDVTTGLERWFTPFGGPAAAPAGTAAIANATGGGGNAPAQGRGAGQPAQAPAPTPQRVVASAAVTLLPGVVLSGGVDGMFRAFSSGNGGLLWEFNTAQAFENDVNGVPVKGGSIGSAGPVVVDGLVYVVSGYIGFQRGVPGNALLVFGTGE